MPEFTHFDLALLNPAFDSPLAIDSLSQENFISAPLSGNT